MTTATGGLDATVRVLLATADRALESRLVDGLPGEGVRVVARALDGPTVLDQALDAARTEAVDVVLVSAGLHGLGEATLVTLRDRGVPVVLLASGDGESRRAAGLAPSVLASAPVAAMAEAIRRALSGAPPLSAADMATEMPVSDWEDTGDDSSNTQGSVVGVVSGKGAPGKSTVAIAIAAALGGSGYRVALVDADLRGGNVAPYLDLDPRRGLVGLAAAGGPLAARLDGEIQAGPGCAVLAGVERPELAGTVSLELVAGTVSVLRGLYDRVVLDLASNAPSGLLLSADRVLLVTGPDMVALWNTRVALRSVGADVARRCVVVVNRREGREHYDAAEVEEALRIPVVGVVREDRAAARHSIEQQVPFTDAGGKAADDLRALASHLDGLLTGEIGTPSAVLPPIAVEA